jgi:hypothetical protein
LLGFFCGNKLDISNVIGYNKLLIHIQSLTLSVN